ncbi:unnamed protein product, partial [Mesorhabditis belari]|uniref:Histone deacetylase 11 n=1 Tax=Mesorhabditis belari TaxID=2138241 RepID=A0AAF3ESN3_9BILA
MNRICEGIKCSRQTIPRPTKSKYYLISHLCITNNRMADGGVDGHRNEPGTSRIEQSPIKTTVHMSKEECAALATNLFLPIGDHQVPVIFHSEYDVKFFGIEKYHVFDASKWGKVFQRLKEIQLLSDHSVVEPREAKKRDLRIVHTAAYLNSLQCSCEVAKIVEMPIVAMIPCCLLDRYLLKRMRFHVGGTVAACRLALIKNWAINIGGGFHHASSSRGGGFCIYADISLAVKMLFLLNLVNKVIILDVDAHQGNGHERDFLDDPRVFIVDVYNPDIYPHDVEAKNAISRGVEMRSRTGDIAYLSMLETSMDTVFGEFSADLIVYNAGTDSLMGDPLGRLDLTPHGIVARDELVFRLAQEHSIPIAMVTSGGYQQDNWKVIADSIKNLHEKKLIYLHP